MPRRISIFGIWLYCAAAAGAVDLSRETITAFEQYIAATEARLQPRLRGEHFLWSHDSPALRQKLLRGESVVQPAQDNGILAVPGGLIADWVGAIFIPNTNLKHVLSVAQDYNRHSEYYKPDITRSHILTRSEDDFVVETRVLKQKLLLSAVFDIDLDIRFVGVDGARSYSHSSGKRIFEVANAGKADEKRLPEGHDRGFLWRLNGYWFFEEGDGGVYINCESITLSRSIPYLLEKLMNPIIKEMPGEALRKSMEQTRHSLVMQAVIKP